MTAPPTPTCPRCGTAVPAGARACSNCGADVSGQQGQAATAYASPGDATRIGLAQGGLIDALRRATVGDYEIKGELGHGGMASVFLAHEVALDRKVAIKVMSPALFSTAGMVERFKREARTAASLSHPHIIPIFAVRESSEIVYFVMKFIEGRSLESIVHQLGQMPIPIVQKILYQVGSALGYAYDKRGVVHRDVKPANIMIDADGWAVVTDFGIAKVSESKALTQTGATIGTPSYMSPEQCAAKSELTGASDQYSLGVVAYEMLAGQLPFQAETTVGLLFAHVHETPPSIADIRPDIPEDVADAVMRMLAKEPEERWPDIETAVSALGGTPLAHDDPIRAQLVELAGGRSQSPAETIRTPMSPVPANRLAPPPATRAATSKERRPATRTGTSVPAGRTGTATVAKRRSPLLYVLPLVVVAGAAGWWFLGRTRPGPQAPAATSATPLAAVETVRVAQPETVRMAAPAPVAPTADTAKPPATPTRPAPSAAASTAAAAGRTAETRAYKGVEAQALAVRLRAANAGATQDALSSGDADANAADVLAQSGHYGEANAKLAAAIQEWTSAGSAAAANPRRGEGAGGGARRGIGQQGGLQAEAQQIAAEFADAFSNKSLARIRVVYPRVTEQQAQEWGDLFLKGSNMTMQLNVTSVNRLGPFEANATFEGAYDYTEIQGGAAGHQSVNWQVTLRQTPLGWKIISLH